MTSGWIRHVTEVKGPYQQKAAELDNVEEKQEINYVTDRRGAWVRSLFHPINYVTVFLKCRWNCTATRTHQLWSEWESRHRQTIDELVKYWCRAKSVLALMRWDLMASKRRGQEHVVKKTGTKQWLRNCWDWIYVRALDFMRVVCRLDVTTSRPMFTQDAPRIILNKITWLRVIAYAELTRGFVNL